MVQEIKKSSNVFLLVVLILSCSSRPDNKISSRDKIGSNNSNQIEPIEIKHLPKNRLIEKESIFLWDSLFFQPTLFSERTFDCGSENIVLTEINYAYDTVINNFSMRLIIHRNILGNSQQDILLKDVNFFVNELNTISSLLKNRIDTQKVEHLGDMLFYDEVVLDPKDCGLLVYKYKYSWNAGGGSSLKGERHYKLTIDDFRKWSSLPMSSDYKFEMGEIIFER